MDVPGVLQKQKLIHIQNPSKTLSKYKSNHSININSSTSNARTMRITTYILATEEKTDNALGVRASS